MNELPNAEGGGNWQPGTRWGLQRWRLFRLWLQNCSVESRRCRRTGVGGGEKERRLRGTGNRKAWITGQEGPG